MALLTDTVKTLDGAAAAGSVPVTLSRAACRGYLGTRTRTKLSEVPGARVLPSATCGSDGGQAKSSHVGVPPSSRVTGRH
jgi:hypothetical protein